MPTAASPAAPPLPPACQALAQLSARLGADPTLIQAAGGNTSVKDAGLLWVKASGLWLQDALHRPLLVPLRLGQVRQRIADGEADPVGPALVRALAPPGLRPSIETTLHALMPHTVVLHVHAVQAIAWSVLPDAPTALAHVLAGLRWAWVPYARPGLALTRAVASATAERSVDVLVLANHGLVIGAASMAEAEQLLATVRARLERPVRPAPIADLPPLQTLALACGWKLPLHPRVHGIATDGLNLQRAQQGALYPDHVVFLGDQLASAPSGLAAPALPAWLRAQAVAAQPLPWIAIPGKGVLVAPGLGAAAEEMAACLVDVLQRLPASPEPCYLAHAEAQDLAHWEAEKFRQQQAR